MTIRDTNILFSTKYGNTRFSMWVSNDKFGKFIIKACRYVCKHWTFNRYKVTVRGRRAVEGKKYGRHGTLPQKDAKFLAIYFDMTTEYRKAYWKRFHETHKWDYDKRTWVKI